MRKFQLGAEHTEKDLYSSSSSLFALPGAIHLPNAMVDFLPYVFIWTPVSQACLEDYQIRIRSMFERSRSATGTIVKSIDPDLDQKMHSYNTKRSSSVREKWRASKHSFQSARLSAREPPNTTPVQVSALANHQTLHLCRFERSQTTKHYTCAGFGAHEPPNTTPVQVWALVNHQTLHLCRFERYSPLGTFFWNHRLEKSCHENMCFARQGASDMWKIRRKYHWATFRMLTIRLKGA